MADQTLLLTPEQLAQYRQDGVLFLPGVFSHADLEQYRAAAEELRLRVSPLEPGKPRLQIEKQQDAGQHALRMVEPLIDLSPTLAALTQDRRILQPLEQIYGEEALLFEDKLNYKPARVGSGFSMHQDSSYWTQYSRNIISVFIHLDDATTENGCLEVVPGFHTRGLVNWSSERDHSVVDDEIMNAERIVATAKAGDVLLFHCLTPHASGPNRTNKGRRALVLSYNPASDGNQYRYSAELLSTYHS